MIEVTKKKKGCHVVFLCNALVPYAVFLILLPLPGFVLHFE